MTSTYSDLRFNLDRLHSIHGCPPLGQKRPLDTTARVYLLAGEPKVIDVAAIRAAFKSKTTDNDVMFDVRVVIAGSNAPRALRVPWEELSDPHLAFYRVPDEKMAPFASSVPKDIDLLAIANAIKAARAN